MYVLTLGILRSEPGLTFIFTFVMAEIGFKTKSQTKVVFNITTLYM